MTRFLVFCLLAVFTLASTGAAESAQRPNVLFIVIDDMNDWIQLLDQEAPIRTPNLERLAAKGMLFTRAYCISAACNPSRAAVLTGRRPSSSGVYGNRTDWRRAMPEAITLPRHFRNHGYRVTGAGKIFHHHLGGRFHDEESFQDFQHLPDPPDAPMPPQKLNGLPDYGSANTDWGIWPKGEAKSADERTVDYCIAELRRKSDNPWFLACGIFRPHMPFFAPVDFFELYPTNSVILPKILDSDTADIPEGGQKLLRAKAWFWKGMMAAEARRSGTWRDSVRAYQASASFADHQVGRLLDALERSGGEKDTVIVLWSDHGYHLGEKHHWEKFALWEKTNHIPFIIVAPGITKPGSICETPVDLSTIYPTLVELCGLTSPADLDGISIVPLLHNPKHPWKHPAVMTYGRGNHAVRTERWRYIRYADGTEELYDHRSDPHEWHNLAGNPKLAHVRKELRQWLPANNAMEAPDLKK